jgi:hypothetical protein
MKHPLEGITVMWICTHSQRIIPRNAQEDVMKTTRALVIGFALIAAVTACAQDIAETSKTNRSLAPKESYRVLNFQKAEVNYLVNLDSPLHSVVESALGHVTLMRIKYPKQDLRKIQEKLYDLASQGATQSVRHKAFTAMQVFANPTAFSGAIAGRQYSGDGLLEELAAQMQM